MPIDDLGWRDLASQGIFAGGLGATGRLLALAAATRRPRGLVLLWEIPLAIGMGVVGKGIADMIGLQNFPNFAMVIGIAYTGPRVIDILLERYQAKKEKTGLTSRDVSDTG
jgi:hypothetical protein